MEEGFDERQVSRVLFDEVDGDDGVRHVLPDYHAAQFSTCPVLGEVRMADRTASAMIQAFWENRERRVGSPRGSMSTSLAPA
jgi:hypothetical protein